MPFSSAAADASHLSMKHASPDNSLQDIEVNKF